MRKLAASLALAVGAFVLVNPSPALAVPSGCTAWNIYANGTSRTIDGGTAKCTGGTGHFRALLYCTDDPKSGWGTYYKSAWVRTPGTSSLLCPRSQRYIMATAYERATW
ncbi:hypothetical protein GCM10022248_15080 [Nonomuraea soli]